MAVRHISLTAGAAQTVSLANRDVRSVGILHKGNGAEPVYVTVDGTATVRGDDTYAVLAGQQRWIPRLWSKGKPTNVSLISAAAVDVEVEFP